MHDHNSRGAVAPILAGGRETVDIETTGLPDGGPALVAEMSVGLTAVVLSVFNEQPVVLITRNRNAGAAVERLPTTQFCPVQQPCLEAALRDAVSTTTGLGLGYIEQLLTDYAQGTSAMGTTPGERSRLSVSYVALTRSDELPLLNEAHWLRCYDLLPWEDFRHGRPPMLDETVLPGLADWASKADHPGDIISRQERVSIAFGTAGSPWDDQRVVDRIDLIDEAKITFGQAGRGLCPSHVRLVAAGLGRLRAKIRYRPLVFELLPAQFTLFELQRTVEAVLGPTLHKQNFRRLVEGTGLVEPTGDVRTNTGGRPAKTFRFRREVLLERPAPGVHVRSGRAA